MKEELVQHIQNLLVSQIKGQTGPPPPPPPPAPVEDEEKENNQILGHINNNVSIIHCIIYCISSSWVWGKYCMYCVGVSMHLWVNSIMYLNVIVQWEEYCVVCVHVCVCVCIFTMIEEVNVHVCVYVMCDMVFVYYL